MAHRLNTNKQFMIGNGLLAFAVIFVVVIFVYMSLRYSRERQVGERYYAETYTLVLKDGFGGLATSVYLNDSLLLNQVMPDTAVTLSVKRFADENALMIVDNGTERISLFELSEKGGEYQFEREKAEVKLLSRNPDR